MRFSPLTEQKTLLEKEIMLVTSILLFPQCFSKAYISRSRENEELFGKGLNARCMRKRGGNSKTGFTALPRPILESSLGCMPTE